MTERQKDKVSRSLGKRLLRSQLATSPVYQVRLAQNSADLHAAQKLRFQVFNLELGEGLEHSYHTQRDADRFDTSCDHLLVEDQASGAVVGTYRLQSGLTAAAHHGYYSAEEFDLSPLEEHRSSIIELGRACVHRRHRNLIVLGLLWRGIAAYARHREARLLLGCSSLTSRDPSEGASAYAELIRRGALHPTWKILPHPALACALERSSAVASPLPSLLLAYPSLGARICAPPAIDLQFGTIDFLTVLDLQQLPPGMEELLA